MTLPVSRIDTIFVPALEPSSAASWYRRVFGLETVFEEPDYVALRFPGEEPRAGTALTLFRVGVIDPDAHPAFNFFAADPELLHQQFAAEGIETTSIQTSGTMRHFDFRDISGNWVNICHFSGAV